MAVRFNALPLTYILVALFSAAVESAAPAPAADCSSLVLNLADCLSYVTVGGTAEKPEGTCCSGLKTVLKTDAECLCEGFRNSAQLGVTLNMTKALALPSACHVSAPSVSNCGLNIVPAMAPGLSPTAAESPTSVPGAPTAAGVEVPPGSAPAAATNSATSVMATSAVLLVLIAVAGVSFSLF